MCLYPAIGDNRADSDIARRGIEQGRRQHCDVTDVDRAGINIHLPLHIGKTDAGIAGNIDDHVAVRTVDAGTRDDGIGIEGCRRDFDVVHRFERSHNNVARRGDLDIARSTGVDGPVRTGKIAGHITAGSGQEHARAGQRVETDIAGRRRIEERLGVDRPQCQTTRCGSQRDIVANCGRCIRAVKLD